MSENMKRNQLNKRIPLILSLVLTSVIIGSFLFSLVKLILEPSKSFVIENRQDI